MLRHPEENSPPPHYPEGYGHLVPSSIHKQPGIGSYALSGITGLASGYSSKEAIIDQLHTRKRYVTTQNSYFFKSMYWCSRLTKINKNIKFGNAMNELGN